MSGESINSILVSHVGMSDDRDLKAFDRVSATCNDEKTNRRTAHEIGRVLRGLPSPAATYLPSDWDDSFEMAGEIPDSKQ